MRRLLILASSLSLGVAIVALACGESLTPNKSSDSPDGSSPDGDVTLDGTVSDDAAASEGCVREPREFASAESVSAIAANANNVYWANSVPDGSIIGCAATGCGTGLPFAVTNQSNPVGLTANEQSQVFWTTKVAGVPDGGGFVHVRRPDGPQAIVTERPFTPTTVIQVGSNTLFWLEPDFVPEGKVMKCVLNGTTCVGGGASVFTEQNINGGLATDGKRVYWTEPQRVGSAAPDSNGMPTQDQTPSRLRLQPTIAANDAYLFYSDTGDAGAGLWYVRPDGVANIVRLVATEERIRAITLSSDRSRVLYLTSRAIFVLGPSFSDAGDPPTQVATLGAEDPSVPAGLAVSGECVYWFDRGRGNKIMNARLPPGPPPK
jgi:hypothetical protein